MATAVAARALLISAAASGQGKTVVTAALARHAVRSGWRVRVFKTGPDFIDPMILARASGQPVYQLDLWMGGLSHCRELLHQAACEADLILVEGVMGLYDGEPSSADLAQIFNLPVALVIDANAMAQTFGAVALGLGNYRPSLILQGVLANRVAGTGHAAMLAESLSGPAAAIRFLGALPHDEALAITDRHLGLIQAEEIADLDTRLERAADAIAPTLKLDEVSTVRFPAGRAETPQPLLNGVRVAVARDAAFSFLYPANMALLQAMGARVSYFSPLAHEPVPESEAIYLPGGYPELHAETLASNTALHASLRKHAEAGKPLLAECGGMMLLFEHLADLSGRRHAMAGVLPGETAMQPALQALALQSIDFPDGELRGHSFHHSRLQTSLQPAWRGRTQRGGIGEAVFRQGSLTASYIHFYWPSNPRAAAALFVP
jgi:cobyrinic acid a,c-diamide synthase